jgi:hypothetical protein
MRVIQSRGCRQTKLSSRADTSIEIAVENGCRLRIGAGVDVAALVRIIVALEKLR